MHKLLCVLAAASLAACASITAGTTQNVSVSTTPEAGARCNLTNEKGTWTVPSTPGNTTVTKAYGPLSVTCRTPGDRWTGSTSLESRTAGAAWGNVLAGGIIGAAIDMNNGAAYLYPGEVYVALEPGPGVPHGPAVRSGYSYVYLPYRGEAGEEQKEDTPPAVGPRRRTDSAKSQSGAVLCRIGTLNLAKSAQSCDELGGIAVRPLS